MKSRDLLHNAARFTFHVGCCRLSATAEYVLGQAFIFGHRQSATPDPANEMWLSRLEDLRRKASFSAYKHKRIYLEIGREILHDNQAL